MTPARIPVPAGRPRVAALIAAAILGIGFGSAAGWPTLSTDSAPLADEAVETADTAAPETAAPPASTTAHRQPADPRLRPSPLVAQFWVAVAVIGAGLVGALGFL